MNNNPFKQNLSEEVWYQTYKWETDKNVYDTFRRVAKKVASIEKDPEYWEEKYFEILSTFKYVPGGRILSNAGTGLEGTTLINCYVDGFQGVNQDSIEGIYDALKRQAKILKSEGGYGFCANVMRPRGAYINGIGAESPGTVAMLDLWDASSSVITSGNSKKQNKNKGKNKIRKGAQMCCLSCWHPAVEEFIVAKQVPGKLTKFNLSVLIHDCFIDAVKNNYSWNLEFPETTFDKYDLEWDGDLYAWKQKGYPTKVYKTFSSAKELWDLIVTSTYNRNEPGIIFIDRGNYLNNLREFGEKLNATNPCGEQIIPIGSSCNLGAVNLTQYLIEDDFDYAALEKDLPIILRFQDSINDITNFPLQNQKTEALNKRRVGIGYMGYGSALYFLKEAYGSETALIKTEKLVSFVTNKLYQASSLLAKEKGTFLIYKKEKYLKSKFVKQALWPETVSFIEKNGMRNSHCTTLAPTGNTGVFANLVSGGLEPVIEHKYIRTLIVPYTPEGLVIPKNIIWDGTFCEDIGSWRWVKEGDDSMLKTEHKGVVYKYDKNRGLTKEEVVYDYAVLEMGEEFWKDKETYQKEGKEFYGKTIYDLKVEEHLNTMAIFAKYIDSSISKTINVPNNYPYADFKDVYLKAYDTGYIKGITTYRMGTMASVVSKETKTEETNRPKKVIVNHAPKRPKDLPCEVYTIQIKGEKWSVFVGLLEGYPFEMFAGKLNDKLPERGVITKEKSKVYLFKSEGREPVDILETYGEHGTYVYSKLLAHGTPIFAICDMTDKMQENVLGFNKAMGRVLKKYIKKEDAQYLKCTSCGSTQIIFQEGCISCRSCGASKCS